MRTMTTKIRMMRKLTDKVSPTVICESLLEYPLPTEFQEMMTECEQMMMEEDPEAELYIQHIFSQVSEHVSELFAHSGFFPIGLVGHE